MQNRINRTHLLQAQTLVIAQVDKGLDNLNTTQIHLGPPTKDNPDPWADRSMTNAPVDLLPANRELSALSASVAPLSPFDCRIFMMIERVVLLVLPAGANRCAPPILRALLYNCKTLVVAQYEPATTDVSEILQAYVKREKAPFTIFHM